MNQNNLLKLKIDGIDKTSKFLPTIKKSEGIISATFDGEFLIVELDEFADEFAIIEMLRGLAEQYSGIVTTVEKHMLDDESSIITENDINANSEKDEAVGSSFFSKNSKHQTVQVRSKKLGGALIERCVELIIALAFLFCGVFVENKPNSNFDWNKFCFLLSFAVSAYEVFFYVFECLTKKKFLNFTIPISVFLILSAVFMRDEECAVLALIFALIVMFWSYSEDKIKLLLEETCGDENKTKEQNDAIVLKYENQIEQLTFKNSTFAKVVSICCLVLAFSPILEAVNKLKEINIYYLLSSLFIVAIAFCSMLFSLYKKGLLVKALSYGIDFASFEQVKKLGNCNEFAIDSDVLMQGNNLKDDALGAIKELKYLKVPSIKTNFNCTVPDAVKAQIDLKGVELNNKKTITVGKEGKDINFSTKKSQLIDILIDEVKYVPLAFRFAKTAVKNSKLFLVCLCLLLPLCAISSIIFTFLSNFLLAKALMYVALAFLAIPALRLTTEIFKN